MEHMITKPTSAQSHERCVNRLKQFRRIATRYEKTARAFLSMLCIAAARLWIKTVNTA
jgi:transposase